MSEETTVEADTAERLADTETKLLMAEAELERLRPLQVAETIRRIGFNPESTSGKVLTELAAGNPVLAGDPRRLAAKAEELGLTAADPVPGEIPLTDPTLPATHQRNQLGTVANRIAERDRSRQSKTARLAEALRGVTDTTGVEEIQLRPSIAE